VHHGDHQEVLQIKKKRKVDKIKENTNLKVILKTLLI
jgi:hypothetical protein